jgi:hypothetical protein
MTERGEIKRTGAKAQKNSGRGKIQKGDAVIGPFVYDIKEYDKSYSVSLDSWRKACTDALKVSVEAEPAIQIVLGEGNRTRLWVISDAMMMELLQLWEQSRQQGT